MLILCRDVLNTHESTHQNERAEHFHENILFFFSVPRPPTIIEQTEGITYALQKLEVRLKCLADALPNVKESKG